VSAVVWPASPAAPLLYKVADLAGENGLLRMSRREIFKQIQRGRLKTVKQGRATFVTAASLAAYVELLEAEASR
jgi:hypothetical protein